MPENREEQEHQDRLQVIADQLLVGNDEQLTYEMDLIVGKRNFKGQFTLRRPSVYDQTRIGIRIGELMSAPGPDGYPRRVYTDFYHENLALMLATLEVVIVKHPQWWKIDEVRDEELLAALYAQYKGWQAGFREPLSGASQGASGSSKAEGGRLGDADVQGSANG